MPLSLDSVKEIHTRLIARYGQDFMRQWEGIDPKLVQADWAQSLGGITDDAIFFALDHLPERVPNASVFRKLCMQYNGSGSKEPKRLSAPKVVANPRVVEREIGKMLAAQRRGFKAGRFDWAKELKRRAAQGEDVPSKHLDMAKDALKVEIIPTPVPIVMATIADHLLPPGMRKESHVPPPAPPAPRTRERSPKSNRGRE